jgi:hypothetical protein
MFLGQRNAFKTAELYAKKQQEQLQKLKGVGPESGSESSAPKSAMKTPKRNDYRKNAGASGFDDSSVISGLTTETKNTLSGLYSFQRKKVQDPLDMTLSVSSSDGEDTLTGLYSQRKDLQPPSDFAGLTISASGLEAVPELAADASAPPAPDKKTKAEQTITLIEGTIQCQEERLDQLQDKIDAGTKQARVDLQQGKRTGAVRAMKKVKLLQFELEKISAAIHAMESQIIKIESALNNAKVTVAMSNHHSTPSAQVDHIDHINLAMESILDSSDLQTEINEILSQPTPDVVMDDDELLAVIEYWVGDTGTQVLCDN